jgi:hypothetical protein
VGKLHSTCTAPPFAAVHEHALQLPVPHPTRQLAKADPVPSRGEVFGGDVKLPHDDRERGAHARDILSILVDEGLRPCSHLFRLT